MIKLRGHLTIGLMIAVVIAVGAALADTLWLMPQLHRLRQNIDNDRASAALIIQQQSNLDQLGRDLSAIQTKQADLEINFWTFLKEDDFFSMVDATASKRRVIIDAPSIADATPTGAVLPRPVSLKIHGSLADVLPTINDLQSQTPLIAFQQLSLTGDVASGGVTAAIQATTLWK